MKRKEKLDMIRNLLAAGAGRFVAEDLVKAAGSARVARSALFLSRRNGLQLEALRDSGHTVVAYIDITPKETVTQKTARAAEPAVV